jgi:hypothetical protein
MDIILNGGIKTKMGVMQNTHEWLIGCGVGTRVGNDKDRKIAGQALHRQVIGFL